MVVELERWKGKLAIVTGASSGIGEAITTQLVTSGIDVLGIARGKTRLVNLKERLQNQPGKFYYYVSDCSKEKDILSAFEWSEKNLGPVHILVNNAGLRSPTNLLEGNTELWKHTLDVNLLGVCIATSQAFKIMKKNNVEGHIINMGSYGGHKVIFNPMSNLYPATKFAVKALTETLRQELNSIGSKIKISTISPGIVETNFWNDVNSVPRNAALKPEDVANAAMYILGTPPHVQVHDIIIKPVGELF